LSYFKKRPALVGTLLLDRATRTDVGVGGVLLAGFLVWALRTGGHARAATLPAGTRSAVYISAAATAGALLGFIITALSVLLALPSGRRLDFLRGSKAWRKFPSVFVRTAWTLGAATIAFTTAIVIDDDKTPSTVMEAMAIVVAAFTILRVAASVLLLGRLVRYSLEDRGQIGAVDATDDDVA
jgi:hypothetical protein